MAQPGRSPSSRRQNDRSKKSGEANFSSRSHAVEGSKKLVPLRDPLAVDRGIGVVLVASKQLCQTAHIASLGAVAMGIPRSCLRLVQVQSQGIPRRTSEGPNSLFLGRDRRSHREQLPEHGTHLGVTELPDSDTVSATKTKRLIPLSLVCTQSRSSKMCESISDCRLSAADLPDHTAPRVVEVPTLGVARWTSTSHWNSATVATQRHSSLLRHHRRHRHRSSMSYRTIMCL